MGWFGGTTIFGNTPISSNGLVQPLSIHGFSQCMNPSKVHWNPDPQGDMDDIDMEFKQRVLEHLRIRAEEAG